MQNNKASLSKVEIKIYKKFYSLKNLNSKKAYLKALTVLIINKEIINRLLKNNFV